MSMEGRDERAELRDARNRWMKEMTLFRALEAEATVEYNNRPVVYDPLFLSPTYGPSAARPVGIEGHEQFVAEEIQAVKERIRVLEEVIRELR